MAAAKIAGAAAAAAAASKHHHQATNQQQAVKQSLQFLKTHPGVFFLNKNMPVTHFLGCFLRFFFGHG